MLDRTDASFAAALTRIIELKLYGDNDATGLYRSILGSPNWDAFNQGRGRIQAFEEVLAEMLEISRRMNGEEAARNDERS